jgi:hypothetical protein
MLPKVRRNIQLFWKLRYWKHTVKFSTGLMNDHFEIAGRLSAIQSDGFVDRGASDLKSFSARNM